MQIIDDKKSSVIAISSRPINLIECLTRCFKKTSAIINVIKFECGLTEESSSNVVIIRAISGEPDLLRQICSKFELQMQSLLPKEDQGKIIKANERERVIRDQFVNDEPITNEHSSFYYFYKVLSNESYGAGKVIYSQRA